MSISVMSVIWKRFEGKGSELLLALALGDFANDDGESIYPSIATLAAKTRQSDRTVQRQLAHFVDIGWLQIAGEAVFGGRGITRRYRINPTWLAGIDVPVVQNGDKLAPNQESQPNE